MFYTRYRAGLAIMPWSQVPACFHADPLAIQVRELPRKVVFAARQRLQLFEELRGRRLAEFQYQEMRELEELASESYLAGFVRELNGNQFS